MKKIFFVLIICLLACSIVYASPTRDNCGCGLGSIAFKDQDGLMSQTAAATTNGLFGNQTFGISSGTLECKQPGKLWTLEQVDKFVADNMDNLAKDISRGSGESLDTLAELMGVPDKNKEEFNTQLQTNFEKIFTSEDVTHAEVVLHIMSVTKNM